MSAAERQAAAATRRDWLLAAPFGVLIVLLVAPWPRPSVALGEACQLQDAGRFAVQCDLEAAAARTGRDWLRRGLRVYEDGLVLRPADRAGDVRRENPGSYHTNGRTLTLASLDRSDPRGNGHAYVVRPAQRFAFGMGEQARAVAVMAASLGFALLCLARRGRLAQRATAGALCAAVACIAVQVATVLQVTPVHVDSGYTLPAAEALLRGAVPYRTLAFAYTPLSLYELALWSRLWPGAGAPSYVWYVGLIVLNEVGCAVMLFLILRRAAVAPGLAALTAAGMLSFLLWFDGGRILLEPLYLLPILAGAWLVLSRGTRASGAAAGALAGVALLVKQYGGFGLLGLLGYSASEGRPGWRRAFWIGVGFAGALLGVLLLLAAQGVEPTRVATDALGAKYPRRYEATWLWLFLRCCTIVLPALATPFLPGAWSRPAVRVGVWFGLAACLPFYFRQHQYYFLLPTPWLFLLFGLGVDQLASLRPRRRDALHALAALLTLAMPLRGALAQSTLFVSEPRGDQLRRARLMTDAWPAERRTLLFGFPGMNAVTRYRSADEAVVGYPFLNAVSAKQLFAGFAGAEGVWIDPRGMYARGADATLRQAGSSMEDQLQKHGFTRQLVLEDRFELWTKGP